MPSPFDHQLRGYQRDRIINGDAEPEIIILANGKSLVESSNRFEKISAHHDRGRAHQAKLQTAAKNISGRLSMSRLGIDSRAPSNPDLFRLANLKLRVVRDKRRLHLELLGQPQIIRIEKREVSPSGDSNACVSCRSDATPRLR